MRVVILLVLSIAAHPPVHAETCVEEAAALRAHLVEEQGRAFRWNTAWAIAFGAAAAGQVALALTETKPFGTFSRDDEETLYVGAAKATIGLGARLVTPLKITVPAAGADPCADVPVLRAALAQAGRRERTSFWLTHLGGTALNFAGAALLTYRRSLEVGAISFAISFPVGPTAAYTQPRRSWHLWRERRVHWVVGAGRTPGEGDAWLAWVGGAW